MRGRKLLNITLEFTIFYHKYCTPINDILKIGLCLINFLNSSMLNMKSNRPSLFYSFEKNEMTMVPFVSHTLQPSLDQTFVTSSDIRGPGK